MKIKRLDSHLKALKELGVELLEIRKTGSDHWRLDVTYHGKQRFFIAAYSASDRRSFLNWRSDVRQWTRTIKENPNENCH